MLQRELISLLKIDRNLFIKEVMRRLLGRPYEHNHILVKNYSDFIILKNIKEKGINIVKEGSLYILRTNFGSFYAPHIKMFLPIINGEIDQYGIINFKDKKVLDVGAFIGDSTVYFIRKGASLVYAYEPIYHNLLKVNLIKNDVRHRVVLFPKGIYYAPKTICVKENYAGSGLSVGSKCFRTDALEQVLKIEKPDVVKMDCEGCEVAILFTSCSALKVSRDWIVETHGIEVPVIMKMEECGFNYMKLSNVDEFISLIYFYY